MAAATPVFAEKRDYKKQTCFIAIITALEEFLFLLWEKRQILKGDVKP